MKKRRYERPVRKRREIEYDLWLRMPSGDSILFGHVTASSVREVKEKIGQVAILLWANTATDVGVWIDGDEQRPFNPAYPSLKD